MSSIGGVFLQLKFLGANWVSPKTTLALEGSGDHFLGSPFSLGEGEELGWWAGGFVGSWMGTVCRRQQQEDKHEYVVQCCVED